MVESSSDFGAPINFIYATVIVCWWCDRDDTIPERFAHAKRDFFKRKIDIVVISAMTVCVILNKGRTPPVRF